MMVGGEPWGNEPWENHGITGLLDLAMMVGVEPWENELWENRWKIYIGLLDLAMMVGHETRVERTMGERDRLTTRQSNVRLILHVTESTNTFTISMILNRIIVRSLTKPQFLLPHSQSVNEQRVVGLGGVESENERDEREKNQFG